MLKQIHVACVALSYTGFFVRGVWMIRDSALLRWRWARILPHANDTLLLAAAIALAVIVAVAYTRNPLIFRGMTGHWPSPG